MSSSPATLPRLRPDRAASLEWARLGPVAIAAALAVVYLVLQPHTADLAAHVYRADLFGREGFTIWDGNWYDGHHTPAYSVLFPPLGWLLGPPLVGALAAVASAALFERLTYVHFGDRARVAALWFGAGAATTLFTGRLPFGLGVAIGLGALLALQRRRALIAPAVAVACSLASPVAGAFLALAAIAYAIARRENRKLSLGLAVAALLPPIALAIAFPEGGYEPFGFSSAIGIPLFVAAALVLLPRAERELRIGTALYGIAGIAAYLIHTPMGGNAVRLGALFGGPLLAGALAGRMPRRHVIRAAVLVTFAALAYWQWWPAIRDSENAFTDPSAQPAYYEPLVDELTHIGGPPGRIEIPFTHGHWEAAEVARDFPLARGWERQLDISRDGIFYGGVLNRITYATWLAEHGVRFVALASAKPDYSSIDERALIETGLPYLKPVWHSKNWRLYEFTLPHPLVVAQQPADVRMIDFDNDSATLDVRRPGPATVKVAWSPYWRARGACVERAGEWTRVIPHRAGMLRLEMSFSLARVLDHGKRCG